MELITAIINFGLFVVGLLGVYVAFQALRTWKHQRQASFAEEVIIYANTLHDLIYDVRSPLSDSTEWEGRERVTNEDNWVSHKRNTFYVPLNRLMKNNEILAKYHSIYLKVKLYSAENISDIEELKKIILDVRFAAEELLETAGEPVATEDKARIKELKRVIWRRKDDDLSKRANSAVNNIENNLKQYL